MAPPIADSVPWAFIVLFRDNVSAVTATARQLIQLHGARETWIWDGAVKGFSVRGLPVAAVAALQQNPLVRLVEPVRLVRAADVQNLPFNGVSFQTSPMWYLDRIDRLGSFAFNGQLQFNRTGAGVHIYIVDSGVRGGHVEFTGRIGNGTCQIALSLGCTSPTIDSYAGGRGHGTSVASAAAGSTFGVAKQAIIHPVRVEDAEPGGYCDDIVSGLNWVWLNAQRPAVVNFSMGGVPNCFSVRDAMDALVAIDILVFKAAGNDSIDAFQDRANRSAGSVIVGATTWSDARSGSVTGARPFR